MALVPGSEWAWQISKEPNQYWCLQKHSIDAAAGILGIEEIHIHRQYLQGLHKADSGLAR